MTDKQVMQQAVDRIVWWENGGGDQYQPEDDVTTALRAAIAQPEQQSEPTEKQIMVGMMALLQCSASELESYSLKLQKSYESDVYRVYQAMCQVQPEITK